MALYFPYYRSKRIYVYIIAVLFFIYGCDNNERLRPPPPRGPGRELKNDSIVKGIVKSYQSNDADDIDKIELQQNSGTIILHFPPHTAQQVLSIAKLNTNITATVHEDKRHNENNIQRYELTELKSDINSNSIDVRSVPPPLPQPGEEIEVSGENPLVRRDQNGRIKALVIQGMLIVLPPNTAEGLVPLLDKSVSITVKGYKRNSTEGFVNTERLNVIKPYSITIDKTTYLLR
jgi:hypothetical protein